MTPWYEIEKTGPPEIEHGAVGITVWLWRPEWKKPRSAYYRKVSDGEPYWHHHYLDTKSILPTDKWTYVVPPDPPEED